jgi:hypothetical protein
MIPWLAEKPWEFAYDASRCTFLATEEVNMVRNVPTAVPAAVVEAAGGPIRMLVAASEPVGLAPLSVDQEVAVIRRGFEPLIEAGLVEIEVIARATARDIHAALATDTFAVAHFIGHGMFDDVLQSGKLLLAGEDGTSAVLRERSARELLCNRGLKLLFLNSCESGTGSRSDATAGLAQALISRGLPALVANQYSVLDASATTFSQTFYWALAHGMSIGRAACEARIAVNYGLAGEPIDWAVPVVYTSNPSMVLCKPASAVVRLPAPAAHTVGSRASAPRSRRVAVWDFDSMFPELAETLARMNQAQDTFDFKLVSLSPPLDVFDYSELSSENTPYLSANRLAKRLKRMPFELRVDVLMCITGKWMRDDDWLNLYGWSGKQERIGIFSAAGFNGLPTSGLEAHRLIANVIVSQLAGALTDFESHSDGAKDCPFSWNEARDLKVGCDCG